MEQEAYFLWVIYSVQNLDSELEGSKEICNALPIIRRVVLKKEDRGGAYKSKRINVDFDPLDLVNRRHAYLVIIQLETQYNLTIIRNEFTFAGITSTQIEAEETKKELERDKLKQRSFLQKKQVVYKVTIEPVLVTEF